MIAIGGGDSFLGRRLNLSALASLRNNPTLPTVGMAPLARPFQLSAAFARSVPASIPSSLLFVVLSRGNSRTGYPTLSHCLVAVFVIFANNFGSGKATTGCRRYRERRVACIDRDVTARSRLRFGCQVPSPREPSLVAEGCRCGQESILGCMVSGAFRRAFHTFVASPSSSMAVRGSCRGWKLGAIYIIENQVTLESINTPSSYTARHSPSMVIRPLVALARSSSSPRMVHVFPLGNQVKCHRRGRSLHKPREQGTTTFSVNRDKITTYQKRQTNPSPVLSGAFDN